MDDRTGKFYVDFENTPFPHTGRVGADPSYLNWRCEMLLTRNREAIEGKMVLDLASHDGRFCHACLKLGAHHVTGVEGRESLVQIARENMTALGHQKERFNFIQGDAFDYLKGVKPKQFDTILCLGIFDHSIRQIEMVRELQRIKPDYFILDLFVERGVFINPLNWLKLIGRLRFQHFARLPETIDKARGAGIERGKSCLIFRAESHLKESSTIDPIDLTARATPAFIELIFSSHGFSLKRIDWDKKETARWPVLRKYRDGSRASYIARPSE